RCACVVGSRTDAPSRPTRRSSDLQTGNRPNGGAAYKVLYWYWDHDIEGDFTSYDSYNLNGLTNDTSVIPNRNAVNFAPNGDNPRSEEHTSELQSHETLVCRLQPER